LSDDFPLYVWYVNIFDALIFLTYPIGIIVFIFSIAGPGGDDVALPVLFATYFMPLFFGLFKEMISIALRILQYLKTISKK